MKLKILLPAEVFLDEEVTKVVAEAENGFFCLMPQHVDFTTALVPGVFSYSTAEGEDAYLADEGMLYVPPQCAEGNRCGALMN